MAYEVVFDLCGEKYPCRLSFNAICMAEAALGEKLLFSQEIDLFTSARALRAMMWAGIISAPNASDSAKSLTLEDVGDLIEEEGAESVLSQMMQAMNEHFGVPDDVEEEIAEEGEVTEVSDDPFRDQ